MHGVGGERVAAGLRARPRRARASATRSTASEATIAAKAKTLASTSARRRRAAAAPRRDAERERDEEAGLGERRDRFDLGVTERMVLVGGLVGDANGEIGEPAYGDVERVMRALGEQRERSRERAGRELGSVRTRSPRTEASAARLLARRSASCLRSCVIRSMILGGAARLCVATRPEANPRGIEPMRYLHTMIRVTDLEASLAFFTASSGSSRRAARSTRKAATRSSSSPRPAMSSTRRRRRRRWWS